MDELKKFSDIIAENFIEISENFKVGLKSKGYRYDEDIMNDAFISSNSALKDKLMDKSEAIKYYWTSYINKYKSYLTKKSETCEELDIEEDILNEIIEERASKTAYNKDIDDLYIIIQEELKEYFGNEEIDEWIQHVCYGKPYKSGNINYLTKKIRRYISNKAIYKNKILKELIENNGLLKTPKK